MKMTLLARLKAKGVSCKANDNISSHLSPDDIIDMQDDVQRCVAELLKALAIDSENDPNTKDSPRRIAKMLVREVCAGRYIPMPDVTSFPNTRKLDDVLIVGPIDVRSMCSHHFAPILGKAWIAVIPSEKVIGISKFARVANWVFARPQIQEEAVIQLADTLEKEMCPKGLAVIVRASHTCMTWRGVKETKSEMITSVMRGIFRNDADARTEILELLR